MRPIRTQSAPDQSGCPTVLVEGRPVAVQGSQEPSEALPRVLADGRPVAVVSPNGSGAATVLTGGEK